MSEEHTPEERTPRLRYGRWIFTHHFFDQWRARVKGSSLLTNKQIAKKAAGRLQHSTLVEINSKRNSEKRYYDGYIFVIGGDQRTVITVEYSKTKHRVENTEFYRKVLKPKMAAVT